MLGAEQYECQKTTPGSILMELQVCRYKDPKVSKRGKKGKPT